LGEYIRGVAVPFAGGYEMRASRIASGLLDAIGPAAIVLVLLLAGLAPMAHAPSASPRPSPARIADAVGGVSRSTTTAASSPAGLVAVGSIPIAGYPVGLTSDNKTGEIDVIGFDDNLTLVSAANDSVVQRVALPVDGMVYSVPTAVAYDNLDNLVYVAQWTMDYCTGCGGPVMLAVDGTNGSVVDTNWNLTGIDVPDYLDCLVFVPGIDAVDACDQATPGRVVEYQGSTDGIVDHFGVGANPSAATLDGANGRVYVANWGSGNVTVVDSSTNAILGWIPVGAEPSGLAVDNATGQLFVANNASDNVTIINTTTGALVSSVSVGCNPGPLAYDAADGNVYVANTCSNNLTAISGTTDLVVGSVPVGSDPESILYDSLNQRIYVANENSSNITVLATQVPPASYAVSFTESGLPAGTNWTVTLNGISNTSAGSTIGFAEPNGTYNYTIGGVAGWQLLSPTASGTLTVNGSAVTVTTNWSSVTYPITFTESGLPNGTNWSVSLNGTTSSTRTTSIEFNESNGTYAFSIPPLSSYTPGPALGNVTVSGAPANQGITFYPVIRSGIAVTFIETGLPNGTTWSITFNGSRFAAPVAVIQFAVSHSGNFSFSVGTVAGYVSNVTSGTVMVRGAALAVEIGFSPTSGHGSTTPGNGSAFEGLSTGEWVLLGAAGAVAAGVAVAFGIHHRRRGRSREGTPPNKSTDPPR
jgi:YVTN family beta-propeller protein